MPNLIDNLKLARRCGVPLLLIETSDQQATARTCATSINSGSPILFYDCVRGFSAANEPGQAAITAITGDGAPELFTDPTTAISAATDRAPDKTVIVCVGAQRIIGDGKTQQAICNSRDPFKATGRLLILLTPPGGAQLPADLAADVYQCVDEPPNAEQRAAIVAQLYKDAELAKPAAGILETAAKATRGLSSYAAEQASALSLTKSGLDTARLWERWTQAINATPGLTVDASGATLDDIGGLSNVKTFARRLMAGRRPPSCIVRVEEIEKAMAGNAGDTSGTSQGILGALLTWMQDEKASGLVAVGPAGSGKSLCSTAIGSAGNVPTITLDLGALKGSLVGQTEANTRQALATIKALAGEGTFWVATCNGAFSLPVELRRRFTFALWFFDLPSAKERGEIWKLWLSRYPDVQDRRPDDTDWTGAEIRTCCDTADRLSITPREAAQYIIPVAKQAPETLAALRQQATGRYISASNGGPYQPPVKAQPQQAGRKMEL